MLVAMVHGQLELDDPDAGALPGSSPRSCSGCGRHPAERAGAGPGAAGAPWIGSKPPPFRPGPAAGVPMLSASRCRSSPSPRSTSSPRGTSSGSPARGASTSTPATTPPRWPERRRPEMSGTGGWGDFVPRAREIAEKAEMNAPPSEVSRWWTDRGSPGSGLTRDAAALYLRKLGALLGATRFPQPGHQRGRRDSLLLSLLVGRSDRSFTLGLFLPLAVLGLGSPRSPAALSAWGRRSSSRCRSSLLLCDRFRLRWSPSSRFPRPGPGAAAGAAPPAGRPRFAVAAALARSSSPSPPAASTPAGSRPTPGTSSARRSTTGATTRGARVVRPGPRPGADRPGDPAGTGLRAPGGRRRQPGRAGTGRGGARLPDSWQAQYGYGLRLFRTAGSPRRSPFSRRRPADA